ncbi:hypothetical protein RCH09_000646 [Actimicrobium sp. GrIS 1.19]|uniref:hypothetical protein n=1 Tax=Actimicrobium sp. GrIS 1.19 TaxID=3071708 RepID=UPI002E08B3A2|nr:hypothetical protein [Actimicrobium sp. GrIS 1.19]
MSVPTQSVLDILQQYNRKDHVQESRRPKQVRIVDVNNDVTCAIENLGGVIEACRLLGVTPEDIDIWIDTYFVPSPFAAMIEKATQYSQYSLQTSTFYIVDQGQYWPHRPSIDELKKRNGRGIYKRITAPNPRLRR